MADTVYTNTVAYAREHGELDAYRESNRRNAACAEAIDTAIRASNYELYRYDLPAAAKSVVAEHGPDRVAWVLANSIRQRDYDGRFSQDNKAWARELPIPDGHSPSFVINTHPTVLDGFIDQAREVIIAYNQLAAAELSTEQNYNMIDGRINNQPSPRADLTDGQTHEEIRELAPGTLLEGKPSLLGQLERLKAEQPPRTPTGRSAPPERER